MQRVSVYIRNHSSRSYETAKTRYAYGTHLTKGCGAAI